MYYDCIIQHYTHDIILYYIIIIHILLQAVSIVDQHAMPSAATNVL